MKIQDVIPILQPKSGTTASVIMNILALEEKLASPMDQTVYFRWGLKSQIKRLSHLKKRYEGICKYYNRMTLDDLISRLIEQERFLKEVVPSIRPLFAQSIMSGSILGQISMLKDYIELKGKINPLPSIAELTKDPDLLLQMLE